MSDSDSTLDPARHGEAFTQQLTFTWINPERIEAGEMIAPALLLSERSRDFAALHLISADLSFALNCLREADGLGIPDSSNLHSKALIFSGVVAYARCFKSGVRAVKLKSDAAIGQGSFDREIHDYIIDLRDKHIAHSVNEFEGCDPVAIVVGRREAGWRDGSGVGVVLKQMVGISRTLLRRAIAHIDSLSTAIATELEAQRLLVYSEFKQEFDKTGEWKPAPIVKLADRANVSKRRA